MRRGRRSPLPRKGQKILTSSDVQTAERLCGFSRASSVARLAASGVWSHDTRASVPGVCEVVSRGLIARNSRTAHRTHRSGRATDCRRGTNGFPGSAGRRHQ